MKVYDTTVILLKVFETVMKVSYKKLFSKSLRQCVLLLQVVLSSRIDDWFDGSQDFSVIGHDPSKMYACLLSISLSLTKLTVFLTGQWFNHWLDLDLMLKQGRLHYVQLHDKNIDFTCGFNKIQHILRPLNIYIYVYCIYGCNVIISVSRRPQTDYIYKYIYVNTVYIHIYVFICI